MQDAFRKKLLQDAENEEASIIKSNLKAIVDPNKQSNLMNRFKRNAARKSEKAKTMAEGEISMGLKSSNTKVTKAKVEAPMNRASVDLTPIMPKL